MENHFEPIPPVPSTPAIIMYTSGSTVGINLLKVKPFFIIPKTQGTPKGVVLTHGNLTHTLGGLLYNLNTGPDDVYIAYLPLAHVLELLGEMICTVWGVSIGYSHPNTLTDK